MTYVQQYFNKLAKDLTYDEIEYFFNVAKDESDKIEFKSYFELDDSKSKSSGQERKELNHSEKLTKVLRSVCGFLNSSGGLLIWGAPIGTSVPNKKEKIFIGELSPLTERQEKDAFINAVVNRITPSPLNVTFNEYEKDGKYIYLIDVEQSIYSPHQIKNIYYMRSDAQTIIAPHHYIESLFKKISFPKLKGRINFVNIIYQGNNSYVLQIDLWVFNFSPYQVEKNPMIRVVTSYGALFSDSILGKDPENYRRSGREFIKTQQMNLYYGHPLQYFQYLVIDTNEIKKHGNQLEISFAFAGDSSPLLTSLYKIKFDFDSPFLNLESLEINSVTDKFIHDRTSESGYSEEEIIRLLLNPSSFDPKSTSPKL